MSSFTHLVNPCTENYKQFKNLLLSNKIAWYFHSKTTPDSKDSKDYVDISFYSHTLLQRPKLKTQEHGLLFSEQKSNLLYDFNTVLQEIISCNSLDFNYLIRANVNCVHPQQNIQPTPPHYDHEFPHKNLIIYLTDAGGETIIFDDNNKKELFNPLEDDIIVFDGLHCANPPKTKPRIILVATYI
jgi:hypothetical protein